MIFASVKLIPTVICTGSLLKFPFPPRNHLLFLWIFYAISSWNHVQMQFKLVTVFVLPFNTYTNGYSNFLPLACTCVSVVLSASRTKPDADGRDLSSFQRTAKWLSSALWAQICSLNLWVRASDVTTSLWSLQSWKGMWDDESFNQIGFSICSSSVL